jgi:signal transduction histidine kinase
MDIPVFTKGKAVSAPPVSGAPLADSDAFDCLWDADVRAAGSEPEKVAAIEVGVPLLALGSLVAVALAGLVAPDAGDRMSPWALGLLLVASLPWIRWLRGGDEGPSLSFMLVAALPLAVLGIGQWFSAVPGPGSAMGYPLLALPGLLLVILSVAAVPARQAAWVAVASYAAFGGPLLAGWIADRGVDPMAVMAWNVGFVLAVVAGYGVRLSYRANMVVAEAREALALQEAAEERRRVARDVHDVVAHTLAVTMLHITGARMAVKRNELDAAVAALEEAERQGRASLADIRRIVRLLRADDVSGLDAAQPGLADVNDLVTRYRMAGLEVDFSMQVDGVRAAPSAELALFRVLQEALTNAARHGQGAATVALIAKDDDVLLEVSNPAGQVAERKSRGSGLTGMQERIAAAGGSFEAGFREGRWTVRAIVPGEVAA